MRPPSPPSLTVRRGTRLAKRWSDSSHSEMPFAVTSVKTTSTKSAERCCYYCSTAGSELSLSHRMRGGQWLGQI